MTDPRSHFLRPMVGKGIDMATAKKSAEALSKDFKKLDERIAGLERQLQRYRAARKKLQAKISEAQANELLGIMEAHEIPFEAAKDILAAAKNFGGKEAEH